MAMRPERLESLPYSLNETVLMLARALSEFVQTPVLRPGVIRKVECIKL